MRHGLSLPGGRRGITVLALAILLIVIAVLAIVLFRYLSSGAPA